MVMIEKHLVLKRRSDLCWHSQPGGWLVYDPLTRMGFRCGEAERWLFAQFDGRQSLADIHRQAGVHPTIPLIAWPEIAALAQTLLTRGLVRPVSLNASQDESGPKRTWLQWFSQSVSWRLRGVNPERFLRWLAPRTDVFFSKTAVQCWLGLMVLVSLCVLADFQRLREQAQLWQWLITPASGSTLFLIFIITRGIHELGHALLLTRFGGRSPDIGVIFMLGAPCVYCDVTESWRLPHAWQRAAVAAGGMLAESIVATLAAIVWLVTVDGVINTLALQTMIVCSISTWLVNANPLMRFDGYYILSDWCDEPNLRARADQAAWRLLKRLALGQVDRAPLAMSQRRYLTLVLFSVCGFIYRLSLSWMMASVIVAMYSAWHFEAIGKGIALGLLVCWWGIPMMKLGSELWRSARSWWARTRLALLLAWLALMIGIVPIPGRQHGTGWVQPMRMQGLYAPQSVRLEKILKYPGARVEPGDIICQLDEDTQLLHSLDLQQHADRAAVQLVSWTRLQKRNEPIEVDLRAAQSAAAAAETQARHAAQAVDRLSIRAELAGKLISLPAPKLRDIDGRQVNGSPQLWLDADQCGRVVPQGTMMAAICSRQLLAVIPLEDSQLRDIAEGTTARILVPSHSPRVWEVSVQAIVHLDELDSMARLVAAKQLLHNPAMNNFGLDSSDSNSSNVNNSDSLPSAGHAKGKAAYAAVIELPFQDAAINCQVQAAFAVPPKTLAMRANDWAHTHLRWLID